MSFTKGERKPREENPDLCGLSIQGDFVQNQNVGEYNNTFRNWEQKIVKEPKMDCHTRRLWYHGGQSRESFQEVNE